MFSDFILFIRSRGRPGCDGGAVLAGLHSGAQAVKSVFEVVKVQVVNILCLYRVRDDFQAGVDPGVDAGEEDQYRWCHISGVG